MRTFKAEASQIRKTFVVFLVPEESQDESHQEIKKSEMFMNWMRLCPQADADVSKSESISTQPHLDSW